MIKFDRNNSTVQVKIEHGIFHNNSDFFTLELNQTYPYQAELLRKAFQDNLNAHLKEIKHQSYIEGWADAKAKRRKRNWSDFFGGWK